jgi:hypothetical protein
LAEKFTKERQENKLTEAMGTKFGQLSDSSREELKQYLKNNFGEEEAEKLLAQSKWNDDLMSGLAAVHKGIGEFGGEEQQKNFVDFLNNTLKPEMDKIAESLAGLTFGGWQASSYGLSDLTASFNFTGQPATNIAIMAAPKMQQEGLDTGYLIDLMA